MPEVTRVSQHYRTRDRDEYSSDDDRSHSGRSRHGGSNYRTVQRYRVTPSRVEEVEDDRRSARLDLPRGERIEIDRRVDRFSSDIERPRSAIDIRPRSSVVERYVEREPIREAERERTRTVVYERDRPRESEYWERDRRPWEQDRDVRETETRIEKRVERREERREQPYEMERYRKETEYYDQPEPPAPIIIRQRQEPQQIIVQEAPAPPPIVLPAPPVEEVQIVRQEVTQEIAHREPEPERRWEDDEYYYRRDVREVGPLRDERYDRRDDRRDRRDERDYRDYSDEDIVVRRKIVKERSRSSSPNHKRHLAEGALAGAGAAALLANHRSKQGNGPEHRGRNVVGGAALGAIGAEVITRARSRYRDHQENHSRSRSRSRHTVAKGALGLAIAGIAAAAAVKYAQNRKANKEELSRGRSRTRSRSQSRRGRSRSGSYSSDEVTTTKTKKDAQHEDPKHRAAQIAKAGVATAAVAGVVNHFRNKSKGRDRSKSRIRAAAEIGGVGLAGAAVAGLYENRKKKEAEEEDELRLKKAKRTARKKSHSRARSVNGYTSSPEIDPELGMVQYGTDPVYTHQQASSRTRGYDPYDPAIAAGAGAAYGGTRSRSRRRRNSSSSDDRERSRSRVRDLAGAGIATGAAALGVNEYKKRKERKEAERQRRRYEEEAPPENYYAHDYRDDDYSPSPPHASGGSYYPANNQFPPPPTGQAYTTHHTTTSTTHVAQDSPIPPYNPADYAQQHPIDPYGYPPRGDHVSRDIPPISQPPSASTGGVPYFPPPPQPYEHEALSSDISPLTTPPSGPEVTSNNKSVNFAPLARTSSGRFATVHDDPVPPVKAPRRSQTYQPPESEWDDNVYDDPSESAVESPRQYHRRRRRNSDPSSDRPPQSSKHRRRHRNYSRSPSPANSDETEVLPDRFDRDGRPIDKATGVGQNEMVERIVHDFGDVVDGRKSWRDLLSGLIGEPVAEPGPRRRRRD